MAAPLQPGGVGTPAQNRQLLSDLTLITPHVWKQFVERYGDQHYYLILEQQGNKELVEGRLFEHFESRGKLHDSVVVQTTVTAPAAGADVTFVLTAGSHASSGTQSPGRVGDVIKTDSGPVEAKIISISTTTPSAHTYTVRPLKTTQAFVSNGSANLTAGEVIVWVGRTEMGEASTLGDTNVRLTDRYSNTTTEISEEYTTTDRAMIEQIFFEYGGQQYIKMKGIDETTRRFVNSIEFKLIKGDTANNLAAVGGSVGTQGLIPKIALSGQTVNYTAGSFDIPKYHEISRAIAFNGGCNHYQWLMDMYQLQEVNDEIFTTYNNGAIKWKEASGAGTLEVGYGFHKVVIDDIQYDFKYYSPFNSEAVYGQAGTSSQYRNFGIMIPQGTFYDTRNTQSYKNLSVVSNRVPGASVTSSGGADDIRLVTTGMFAPANTENSSVTTTANLSVRMLAYKGLRTAGANQFIQVKGS